MVDSEVTGFHRNHREPDLSGVKSTGSDLASGGERSIDAGSTDLEPLGDLGGTQALGSKLLHIFRADRGWPSLVETLGLPGVDASALACSDEVLLDHPDHAEDGQHHLAHDVAAIEGDLWVIDLEDGSLLHHP